MARYTSTSPLRPPVRLDTGAWRVEALIPPGVQTYRTATGAVREYVPPEELQRPEYTDALAGLPVLWRDGAHPEGDGIVSADDLGGARRVGTILGQRWTDDGQAVEMSVDDPADADLVRQYPYVSLGYRADRDPRPGVAPDGTPYDVRQTRRRQPNHIVLTHAPRAGYAAAVRLDAEDDPVAPAQPVEVPMDPEMVAKILAMLEGLSAKIDALKPAEESVVGDTAGAKPDEAPPRMDSVAGARALLTAADRLGVTLDPAATLPAARQAVLGAMHAANPAIRLDTDDAAAEQAIAVYATVAPVRSSHADRVAGATVTPSQQAPVRLTA